MKIDDKNIIKIQESEKILSPTNFNIINKNDLYTNFPQRNKEKEKLYTKIFIALTII